MVVKKAECTLEFLVVSKSKLKIILDREEVEKYSLSDFSSGESVELRARLGEILDLARERVGFFPSGERLLVSYYPTRLSGAELFVSVVGISDNEPVYYIFKSLDELVNVSRAVLPSRPESRVHLLPGGEYCLELTYPDGRIDVATEFTQATAHHRIAPLLAHARLLASEDAVALFSRL